MIFFGENDLKNVVLVCGLAAVAGCTTELSQEATKVRRIPASIESGCQFLGPVSGAEYWGMSIADDAESALNQVRNKVAEMGGNAYVINGSSSTYEGSIYQADAYRCP